MSTTNSDVIGNDRINLLDELQVLLKKQIDLARQGNIRGFEVLSKQADSLVGKIAQTGILSSANAAFDGQRREQLERLRKLYEKLCLAITAQKADVSEKINQVRKGKRTMQAYSGHI
ncbi:MAG: hypothetical protein ACYS32_18880 [Planctomycetota bacterium]|jgi:hypothetical protein